MEKVAIVRRADDGGYVELLRLRVEAKPGEDAVEALAVFANIILAVDYADFTPGIGAARGWLPVEVGPADLVSICAALVIGYVALPTGPGLGEPGVAPVLEFADSLAD